MSRLRLVVTVLVSLVLLCPQVMVAAQYRLIDLGCDEYDISFAEGINNHGEVVGMAHDSYPPNYTGVPVYSFLYQNNTTSFIVGPNYIGATDINDQGQIIGGFMNGTFLVGPGAAWLDPIANAAGHYLSKVNRINNSGWIIGEFYPGGVCLMHRNGTVLELMSNVPGYGVHNAYGINDLGQVVGDLTAADGSATHAFLYSNGITSDLNSLTTTSGWTLNKAVDINESGQIVGTGTHNGIERAFRMDADGTVTDLGEIFPLEAVLYGDDPGYYCTKINEAGKIVGRSTTARGENHAFLYDGQMIDLNTILEGALGWTVTGASSINDYGWIAGMGTNADGQERAILLIPTPEPSGFLIIVTGTLAIAFAVRRHRCFCEVRHHIAS